MSLSLIVQTTVKLGPKLAWQAHWASLLFCDNQGDWTIATLARCAGLDDAGARNLLRKLISSGIAEATDRKPFKVRRYRLVSRPAEAPRLGVDATREPLIETVWRAIKMAKTFTALEIAQEIGQEPAFDAVRRYLLALAGAGVLASTGERGSEVFRVRRPLGASPPVPVKATGLFDAAADTFIGPFVVDEVAP